MTTEIHAATQAIREALAAGPTPGPWLEKGRVNPSREAIRIESHHPADEHHLYQVCDVLDANGYPRNQANLQFIAACNPEAITTILAALEARDAEIAALREEVMELPLCATEKYTLRVGQVYRFVPVVGCASCARLAAQALASYGDESPPKPPPRYPSTEGQRIARQIREGKEGKEKP